MKIKRPYFPKFLSDAEHRLLLRDPESWSARTHLVLWYGLLFMLVLAVISFIVPDDPRLQSKGYYWLLFVSIVSIISLTCWLIYLLRFNVFKRYGRVSRRSTLTTFVLYFISAGIIVLFNYVQPAVESIKANNAYGDDEIVNDINNINIKISQLEYDSLDHRWDADTILLVNKSLTDRAVEDVVEVALETITDTIELKPRTPYIQLDSTRFRKRFSNADSAITINDSMFVDFICPDYQLVNSYYADKFTNVKILTSAEIYRKHLQSYRAPSNKEPVRNELNSIIHKYINNIDTVPTYYFDEEGATIQKHISRRYYLATVRSSIGNIVDRKYRWSEDHMPVYIRLFYYFSLFISLLVFIFRYSTVKTFFLSLLTGVILSILTALFLAFSTYSDSAFFRLILFYSALFFFVSLLTWSSKTRNIIAGISLNLFVLVTPLLPLLMVAWYYSSLSFDSEERWERIAEKEQYLLYAECAGGILLVVLIATYFYAAYRKWYALPEE